MTPVLVYFMKITKPTSTGLTGLLWTSFKITWKGLCKLRCHHLRCQHFINSASLNSQCVNVVQPDVVLVLFFLHIIYTLSPPFTWQAMIGLEQQISNSRLPVPQQKYKMECARLGEIVYCISTVYVTGLEFQLIIKASLVIFLLEAILVVSS